MRIGKIILGGLLALSSIAGCESRIPKQDLGIVSFDVPAVPGSDKRPPMPELEGKDSSHESNLGQNPR